jgi:Na+/H+ antiporter NhaD/arsenite permease-like protein
MALFNSIQLFGIDFEFFIFALTLVGVAVLHHHTLKVALTGLATVMLYKLLFTSFNIPMHLVHEWKDLLNLFGLLIGFTILADYFEHSGVPAILPRYLPDDWKGPFALLIIVFVLSAFLDSIAAVMIGGGIAHTIFKRKVHIGYIVGIVAASNAGGSGSVLGNITTTMMWVQGVAATDVLHAYAAAAPALLFGGFFASRMQHNYQPILKDEIAKVKVSTKRLIVCVAIIVGAIATNVLFDFPVLGVWAVILVSAFFVRTGWKEAKAAVPGSVFLLALVIAASMMPVEQLPEASWQTALVLGLVSSVFDNIPLTKLALTQGGYDWGVLAYTVGYGGSLIWFGSSAGVAITNLYPKARSVADWVKNGWYVLPAYLIGFAVIMLTLGWHPHAPHKDKAATETTQQH